MKTNKKPLTQTVTGQIGKQPVKISPSELMVDAPITPTPYKSWAINAVMRDIYDLGESIQYFPILLGEVAKQIQDNPDSFFDIKLSEGQKIEWGLPERQLTPEVKSLFQTWNFKENDRGYEYSYEYVPVQIVIIKRRYNFFERPDTKFYKVDEFKLPNPFEKYYKARFLIR